MKKIIAMALLLTSLTVAAQKKGKWIQLFNGKDLTNWTIKIKDHPFNENWGNTFRVEDGVMKVRYDQYDDGHIYFNQ
jgi:hypothetical protein